MERLEQFDRRSDFCGRLSRRLFDSHEWKSPVLKRLSASNDRQSPCFDLRIAATDRVVGALRGQRFHVGESMLGDRPEGEIIPVKFCAKTATIQKGSSLDGDAGLRKVKEKGDGPGGTEGWQPNTVPFSVLGGFFRRAF